MGRRQDWRGGTRFGVSGGRRGFLTVENWGSRILGGGISGDGSDRVVAIHLLCGWV